MPAPSASSHSQTTPETNYDATANALTVSQMVLVVTAGTFQVGEKITDDSDPTIWGIVTDWDAVDTIQYQLVSGVFSAATGAFTGQRSGATGTAVNSTTVTGTLNTHTRRETANQDGLSHSQN